MISNGLVTSANSEISNCSVHIKKKYLFVCMDPSCNKSPQACVLCIKHEHSLCDDKFLKDKENFLNEVKIKNVTSSDVEGFKEQVLGILQEKEADLVVRYQQYLANSLNFLGSESVSIDCLNTVEALREMKKKCKITIKDDDTFEVAPTFDPTSPNLEEDLETFEEDIDNALEVFLKDLNRVRLKEKGKMSIKDFIWHSKLGRF